MQSPLLDLPWLGDSPKAPVTFATAISQIFSIWEMVELKMLDFSDCTGAGISIRATVQDFHLFYCNYEENTHFCRFPSASFLSKLSPTNNPDLPVRNLPENLLPAHPLTSHHITFPSTLPSDLRVPQDEHCLSFFPYFLSSPYPTFFSPCQDYIRSSKPLLPTLLTSAMYFFLSLTG